MSETITKTKRAPRKKKEVELLVEAPSVEKKEYKIDIKINDKEFSIETNDIREAILSTEPDFLRTRVILKITKGDKTLERMLYLQQAKMLFINRYAMDAFLKNLIF